MLPSYPLSWALACASRTAHVRSNSSSSFITVPCQVVFGLPLVFLFSVGAHLMATSNILSVGIFRTWTRHHGLRANNLTSEGDYGRFKKKNIPQTDFDKKRKSCKEITSEKNILLWKKYLAWPITLEKISYTVECWGKILSPEFWGKKSLPKPNHTYTPSKVKRTTLNPIFWVTVAIKSRFVAFFSPALRTEYYVFFILKTHSISNRE